jgi:predicted NUDIX family NTP pyrophosphohydrolase
VATARRETPEETSVAAGELTDLGHIDYKKCRQRIFCFAGPAPAGAAPHPASWEVDRAEFLPIAKTCRLIHPDQAEFLDRLLAMLGEGDRGLFLTA